MVRIIITVLLVGLLMTVVLNQQRDVTSNQQLDDSDEPLNGFYQQELEKARSVEGFLQETVDKRSEEY